MSQPTHRHDLAHIGLVPVSQLASGTPTSGMVPTYSGVANAAWGFAGGWGANPMTAQDDLIVGGAPSSGIAPPARLGKGSDGQVLTVDPATHHLLWANNAAAERGSSFPAQPAYGNNVPFYRTDLGEWYYYDGTRWLSQTIYQTVLTPQVSIAATGNVYTPVPLDFNLATTRRDTLVLGVCFVTNVTAPNNAGAYWSMNAIRYPSATNIGNPNTSGDTAGTYVAHAVAPVGGTALTGTTDLFWQVYCITVGSPGTLYVMGFIEYRKVAT